ncbi:MULTISPECIES: phosphonate ABC transporter, permease protein PhnE [Bacillus]|uniref:phosphonate ABC transporter, permease protein PhnE n=1 Tax=Bacillus TaxID=1386 RepID=UPI000BB91388|nr:MULTISPECIES: phosphonate ABC transporter, permease protein PhnE [Bacillus]
MSAQGKTKTQEKIVPKGVVSPELKRKSTMIFIAVAALYFWSTYETGSTLGQFFRSFPNMINMFGNFFPPNLEYVSRVIPALLETFYMAVIASTISTILTIPFCLLAARNISTNKYIYQFVRFFLNIIRTIPDIILAVVFVGIFGIGAFPGIVALIIFSLGILAKLLSDTLETIDMQPLDAMRASGANSLQTIWYGVVPQILPQFVSFSLYVFEINIRASVVLGLVGAGGIGLLLDQQIKFFRYDNAMMLIIVVFIAVVIIEYISTKIREAIV